MKDKEMVKQKTTIRQYEPGKEREKKTRKNLACRRCRHRKQKCDNVQPKCGNCTKSGEECLPTKRASTRPEYPAKYVVALEEHLNKLEAQLLTLSESNGVRQVIESRPQRPISLGPLPEKKKQESLPFLSKGSDNLDQSEGESSSSSIDPRTADEAQIPRAKEQQHSLAVLDTGVHNEMQKDIESVNMAFAMLYPPIKDTQSSLPPLTTEEVADFDCNAFASTSNMFLTSEVVGRVFANAYFETIQPQYPFLHRATWNLWWTSWMDDEMNGITNPSREWRGFFINIVYSIGAKLLQANLTEDMANSSTYHTIATSTYLHRVFQHPSRELHLQALLLLSIHALYSSSNSVLSQLVHSCMKYCITNNFHQTNVFTDTSSVLEEETRERIFWSSYALECAVCTVLDTPTSLPEDLIGTPMFESIDDERLRHTGNYPLSYRDGLTASAHLYRLRTIQSGILARHLNAAEIPKSHISQNMQWMEDTHAKVNAWRRQIPNQADFSVNSPMSAHCLEFEAMNALLLLYRPHKVYLEAENCEIGERAIKASCAVCLAFKRFGLGRQTSQPWLKVLPYFQAGITLLYCLSMTPESRKTPLHTAPVIARSIRACSEILTSACAIWPEAGYSRDLFGTLASIFFHQKSTQLSSSTTAKLNTLVAKLRRTNNNKWVIRMIQEILMTMPKVSDARKSSNKVIKTATKAPRKPSLPCSPRDVLKSLDVSPQTEVLNMEKPAEVMADFSKFDWAAFVASAVSTPTEELAAIPTHLTPPETREGSIDEAVDQLLAAAQVDLSVNACEELFSSMTNMNSAGQMDEWLNC